MTMHSQDNSSPVHKLLSKQRQNNKENVLPSTSRATRSTQSPLNRPILKNLTNKSTQKQQSRLDEIREGDLGARQNEYMTQLYSPMSSQVLVTNHPICHSGKGSKPTSRKDEEITRKQQSESESDGAVTLKAPNTQVLHQTKTIRNKIKTPRQKGGRSVA